MRGPYRQYDEGDLTEAAKLIADGVMTKDEVKQLYGGCLPESTLNDHVKAAKTGKPVARPGRPQTLDKRDEAWLAAWIKLLARLGVAPNRGQVLRKAREIAAIRGAHSLHM